MSLDQVVDGRSSQAEFTGLPVSQYAVLLASQRYGEVKAFHWSSVGLPAVAWNQ
jgi:hypothetical protein